MEAGLHQRCTSEINISGVNRREQDYHREIIWV